MLCTHEYDIPLLRIGHGEGPHVLNFLSVPLSLSYDRKRKWKFWGLKDSIFSEWDDANSRDFKDWEAVHGTL